MSKAFKPTCSSTPSKGNEEESPDRRLPPRRLFNEEDDTREFEISLDFDGNDSLVTDDNEEGVLTDSFVSSCLGLTSSDLDADDEMSSSFRFRHISQVTPANSPADMSQDLVLAVDEKDDSVIYEGTFFRNVVGPRTPPRDEDSFDVLNF